MGFEESAPSGLCPFQGGAAPGVRPGAWPTLEGGQGRYTAEAVGVSGEGCRLV